MLKRTDLIILLTQLQEKGINVDKELRKAVTSTDIPLDIVKFVNDNRPLDVSNFYEQLRKSYNNKRSSLYINLVKEELKDPKEALVILASLNLQVLLFAKHLEDPIMFLSHSRAEEITRVLNNYYKTFDLTPVLTLRTLIKADLKAFESIK